MIVKTDNSAQQKDIFTVFVNESKRIESEVHERAVRKVKNVLLRAGCLCFFWEIIRMYNPGTDFTMNWLIIAFAEAGTSIGLAFCTKTKPYSAILGGLIFFIGLIIITTVSHTLQQGSAVAQKIFFSDMIIKVIIIASFTLQLKDAKALQEIKKLA